MTHLAWRLYVDVPLSTGKHRRRRSHSRRRDRRRRSNTSRYSASNSPNRSQFDKENLDEGDRRRRNVSEDRAERNNVPLAVQPPALGELTAPPVPSLPPSSSVEATEVMGTEAALDAEVLQLIGDRIIPVRTLAPVIHSEFSIRIQDIVKKGLPAEERKSLLEKFPPPANALFMDPPKLNPEVKACLQEALVKRDERIIEKQERIGACLAGMAKLTSLTFSLNGDEKLPLIEIAGGVTRILADLQREESLIRRSLILKNIEASLRDSLSASDADSWLFGEDLAERIKAAKALVMSSASLKPKTAKPQTTVPKNEKGPQRRPAYKTKSRGAWSGQKLSRSGNHPRSSGTTRHSSQRMLSSNRRRK